MLQKLIATLLLGLASGQRAVFYGQNVPTPITDSQMSAQVAQYVASQTSPWTWAFVNNSGNVLYLFMMTAENPSTITVTYNGVAMALLGTSSAANGTADTLALFRLSNPAKGSNSFVVTLTPSSSQLVQAAAISFTGAGATPDSGTATTANDGNNFTHTAFPLTLTSTTSGNTALEAVCFGDPIFSSVSDTLSANTAAHPDGGGVCNNFALQYGGINGTSKTLTINGNTATSWAAIGIEVRH